MPTDNRDWEERFKNEFFVADNDATYYGTYGIDDKGNRPTIKSKYAHCPECFIAFICQEIRQAKIEGKIEGLKEARRILYEKDIEQEIFNLKQ